MGYDDDDDYPEATRDQGRFQAPADFEGPTARRSCTDVIFALLMLICWIGMTAVGKC
jgi:hypothetical protein